MNIMNSTLKYGSENIASELRREILNGQILAPEKLPAERELAEKYQVSRGTVRAALSKLEKEKFIEIKPGSGAFVIHKTSAVPVSEVKNAMIIDISNQNIFKADSPSCYFKIMSAISEQGLKWVCFCISAT